MKKLFTIESSFIQKYDILCKGQYGFRKNHSTQLPLMNFMDKLTKAIDKNEYVVSLFIDLSKAFDTIDYAILLKKLYCYGIRGVAYDIIKNYLTNRLHFVAIHGYNSSTLPVNLGVPQGSILGSILFLLYINDIHRTSLILSFILFADDTTILFSSKDLKTLFDTINKELISLSVWFRVNKLSVNISKTNYILFKSCKVTSSHPDLLLDQQPVKQVG